MESCLFFLRFFVNLKSFSMTKRACADKVFNTFAFEQKTMTSQLLCAPGISWSYYLTRKIKRRASTSVILFPVKPRDSKYITRRKTGYSFNFIIINDNE